LNLLLRGRDARSGLFLFSIFGRIKISKIIRGFDLDVNKIKINKINMQNTTTRPQLKIPAVFETSLNGVDLSFANVSEYERTKHVHRLHPYLGKFIPQLVEVFLKHYGYLP